MTRLHFVSPRYRRSELPPTAPWGPIPRAGGVNSIQGGENHLWVSYTTGTGSGCIRLPPLGSHKSDRPWRRHVSCQNLPLSLVMLCCGMGEGSRWWTDLFFKLKHEGCRVTLVRFNAGCWTAPHMPSNTFTVLIHSRAPGACRDSTVASCHAVA